MKILVGNTGFVGSNLISQTDFDAVFNSKNIEDAFGLKPDLLVYSGVRAEKFLANKEPEVDFEIIQNAIENIKKINPKKVVLISSVDVYPSAIDVNENTIINQEELQPYGKNRLYLERWVEENCTEYLIVRLPGLFGENIKKNFLYDIIHVIPAMLNEVLFQKYEQHGWIKSNYTKQTNGFYKLNAISKEEREVLKNQFLELGFSALNFTDSRGIFQFYNLKNLWNHIQIAFKNDINKLNLATEPVTVNEIYKAIFDKDFDNQLTAVVPHYDFQTVHSQGFGPQEKYIQNKEMILDEILHFIKSKK